MPPAANLSNNYERLSPEAHAFLFREHGLLIDGRMVAANSGAMIDVHDPSSGRRFTRVAEAGRSDVDRAVGAARGALEGSWSRFTPFERERMMHRLADLIETSFDQIAEIESVDNGKPLSCARAVDVALSLELLRYSAGWPTKICGRTMAPSLKAASEQRFHAYTVRQPVGVIAAILPWNYPFYEAVLKLAPALAAGCTIVMKPSEDTPLSALRLAELVLEADLPPGVVNIIPGYGATAGDALARHPGVDLVSFTGSTATGRKIGAACADGTRRLMLELGGKSPVIIFPDADIDAAIAGAAEAILVNSGQDCTAGSRLFVHQDIFDRVVEGVAAIFSARRIGPGLDPATELGPLTSLRQRDRVLEYVATGRKEGARLLLGGRALEGTASYVEPALFVDASADSRIMREEIFGPVLVAAPFSDFDDALAKANDTSYGLAASVWSQNVATTNRMIAQLRAGTVWVNAHGVSDPSVPVGGFGQSGYGKEMGEAALEHYTEGKAVFVAH